MDNKVKNFIYFFNGSMGDILMSNFLFENIKRNRLNCYAVVPKNKKMFEGFSDSFNIIEASLKRTIGLFYLFKFIFSKNYILTAPTPGVFPLRTKIFAKLLSFRGKLVGYNDEKNINKYIYDEILDFDTSVLYYELLLRSLNAFDLNLYTDKPEMNSEKDLDLENYLVIHPFGSNKNRSILRKELKSLIKETSRKFKGKIFVTGSENDEIPKGLGIEDARGLLMKDLIKLINNSKFYIGVDTGPTHIASLLKKKSLVIAHNGTPNWLPYYNSNSRILYNVEGCVHEIYEGKEHLDKCRGERLRCLNRVPEKIILKELDIFLNEK